MEFYSTVGYLDLKLSIKVVASFDEAVAHIARHGSGLAEAIVTRNKNRAARFLREVDAGASRAKGDAGA